MSEITNGQAAPQAATKHETPDAFDKVLAKHMALVRETIDTYKGAISQRDELIGLLKKEIDILNQTIAVDKALSALGHGELVAHPELAGKVR